MTAPSIDLAGQAVVGTRITSPWFAGTWEVTQGWGQTDYGGEPEGHGYAHWHAGVDVGLDCGTVIQLPAGLTGTAKALDNPGGYGTALIVQLDSGLDILLGHLRQRLVSDGDQMRPGQQLGVSNNTGNSTGCHLHFEARPHGGRYGTDVDPSEALLSGTAAMTIPVAGATTLSSSSGDQNPYNALDPRSIAWELQHGLNQASNLFLAGGEVLIGGVMLLGGLLVTGYGLRGKSGAQLQSDARQVLRRPAPRPGRRPASPAISGAERTRVRVSHQRQLPPEPKPGPNIMPGGSRSASARLDPITGLPRYRPRP